MSEGVPDEPRTAQPTQEKIDRAEELREWAEEEIAGMKSYGVTLLLSDASPGRIQCSVMGQNKSFTNSSVTFFHRDGEWGTPRRDDYHVVEKATAKLNEVDP